MSTRLRKFAKAALLNETTSNDAESSSGHAANQAALSVEPFDETAKAAAAGAKRKVAEIIAANNSDSDSDSDDDDVVLQMDIGAVSGLPSLPSAKKSKSTQEASASLPVVAKYSQQRSYTIHEQHTLNSKFPYWNDDMDALLLEATALYGNQWMKVAAYVGHGKSDRHCFKRWSTRYRHNASPETAMPWTDEDEATLLAMAQEMNHEGPAAGPLSNLNLEWETIAAALSIPGLVSRTGKDCKAHLKLMEFTEPLIEEALSKEEVDFLGVRVRSWPADKPRWRALGREMRRDPKVLQDKWTDKGEFRQLSKAAAPLYASRSGNRGGVMDDSDEEADPSKMRGFGSSSAEVVAGGKGKKMDFSLARRIEHSLSRFSWTPETDALLAEGYEQHGSKWRKVAAHVGNGVTNVQCQKRWSRSASNPAVNDKQSGPWTEAELAQLRELADTHVIQGGGKNKVQCINWATISTILNRPSKECMVKHKTMLIASMKKGRFTPDEDDIIVQTVREWQSGGLGQGLWASLEKTLNRNAASILTRWNLTLSKTTDLADK